MMNEKLFSTGKDDWETPDALFQRYHDQYHFVLDLAANETNHKVDRWLGPGGEHEDALAVSWTDYLTQGNLWLNPPYSRALQPLFIQKAAEEVACFNCGHSIVCLLPARTDTRLFHNIILPYGTVTFLRGRLTFKGAPAGAPFPSMIVVFTA